MSHINIDNFINDVISHVKFKYDRKEIKEELKDHLEESIKINIDSGLNKKEAEQTAIKNMGNASEIGKKLNEEHNIFLGYIYLITKNIMLVLLSITILMFLNNLVSITNFPINKELIKGDDVSHIRVNERVEIDNRVIKIKDVYYTKDKDLILYYETYTKKFKSGNWSFHGLGQKYVDNLNNEYDQMNIRSYNRQAFYKQKCVDLITNFDERASAINIYYDMYNRKYTLEIQLKEGE